MLPLCVAGECFQEKSVLCQCGCVYGGGEEGDEDGCHPVCVSFGGVE